MKRIVLSIITLVILLSPVTSFALWNCELEVANDEDTDDTMSTENEYWGYDPCVVGDFDKSWLEKQGLSKDKYGYYNDCRSIKTVVEKISEDQGRCNINDVKGNHFNFVLFQTKGFGDPNWQIPSGCEDKSEAECLWDNYDTDNGGYQKITEQVIIGKEGQPRTIVIAGYNVFMPSDRGNNDTCFGNNCDHFANDCKGGSFGPMCPDFWEMRLIENEISLDDLDSYYPSYPEESPIHPGNWDGGTGEVTIFAGNRSTCAPSAPCGSYSNLVIDSGNGKPAFVVNKGSTLILRDLLVSLTSGHIEVQGTLIMTNVVFNYTNDNSSPEPAIVAKKDSVVHLTDPNQFSESALLKSSYTDHGKYQFGITRFIMPAKLLSSLGPDFSYIKISDDNDLKTNNYKGEWVDSILHFSTALPDGYLPVASDKKVTCSIYLGWVDFNGTPDDPEDDFTPVECKDSNGKPFSIDPDKECLNIVTIGNDGNKDILISRAQLPEKKKYPDAWGKFYDLPLSTYICEDREIIFKPACASNENYIIEHVDGSFSCEPLPASGNGWVYNENELKFDCAGSLTQDGACITECPYGMEYSKETNNCECKADKSLHTITYRFVDEEGTVTPEKTLDICYTQCPEGKVNEIDTYTLKISAPVGKTIYSFTPVFTGADKCVCPKGLTDSTLGCIDVPAKQKECLDKNASAVHGEFSWDETDYKCEFDCKSGFIKTSEGVCKVKCDSYGKIAASDGNSCTCDTANHWTPYSGGECKCEEGYTLSGNICVPDNDPVAECSSDSDCDDDEACKDGECQNEEPQPFKGECKSNGDCGTGMICLSSNNKCVCDTDNHWFINDAKDGCEHHEDEAVEAMCKLNDGQYLDDRCVYNPDEITCLKSDGKWKEKACWHDPDGDGEWTPDTDLPPSNSGSGCGTISNASLPESLGSLLPYLLVLGIALSFPRKRESSECTSSPLSRG